MKIITGMVISILFAGFYSISLAEAQDTFNREDFSANVTLTSDYISRGISQTDGGPAIQGGFDYEHPGGIYLGVWGSNVDFSDDASMELDIYGGYSGEVGGFGYDFGIVRYMYPNEGRWNTNEVYFEGSYQWAFGHIYHDWDNDLTYWLAGTRFDLPYESGLYLHLAYHDVPEYVNFTDWEIAASRSFLGLDFELAYTDTDLSKSECGDTDQCSDRGILTISKSF